MTTEQSDGACTPSFSSDGLGGDDLVATLRKFADIAEAGDKPHWAGAMRVAATEIRQLRDLLAEAVSLRPFWPFPLGDGTYIEELRAMSEAHRARKQATKEEGK